MLCLVPLNKRNRLPTLFVALWSANFVAGICYLPHLTTLPPRVPQWPEPPPLPRPARPPKIDQATYDAIKDRMPNFMVYKLLGSNGMIVDRPEWQPRTLRDLPGFMGERLEEYKVEWRMWTSPDSAERWIIVGFVSDGSLSHTPFVVGKRKHGF